MIEFTFDNLFRTTNKGLPDTNNLQPYSYLAMDHFVYSLIVEIIIVLVITAFTALSAYRAFYNIKNHKFNPLQAEKESQQQQSDSNQEEENDEIDDKKEKSKENTIKNKSEEPQQTNDNLIYRFDGELSEKEDKDHDQDHDEKENQNEQPQQQEQQQVSEQTTEWYLDIDHKILFLQSFLIPFVVVVNLFASNIIVVILLGLSLILFYLFNIKGCCSGKEIMQILFTLPCIGVFLMVFLQDQDMST